MYRLLEAEGENRERRDQLVHPPYRKPELLATGPNHLWSWNMDAAFIGHNVIRKSEDAESRAYSSNLEPDARTCTPLILLLRNETPRAWKTCPDRTHR